ncbi:MAG: hypothetical protein K9L68_15185 [Spirochaetales bacterium]|nr:hypothetical protein [Spirochaetales bacterium]MCF7939936.1 hypothetical protein [Spirochaetales bacterium]
MTANLPDINLLIALSWKNHIHHAAAQRWFAAHKNEPFITCPITESGFVRLSMNPNVVGDTMSFPSILAVLHAYHELPNHEFWTEDFDFLDLTYDLPVVGHRQVTDAYLLGLCSKKSGRLVTFDKRISSLTENNPGLNKHILLLSPDLP